VCLDNCKYIQHNYIIHYNTIWISEASAYYIYINIIIKIITIIIIIYYYILRIFNQETQERSLSSLSPTKHCIEAVLMRSCLSRIWAEMCQMCQGQLTFLENRRFKFRSLTVESGTGGNDYIWVVDDVNNCKLAAGVEGAPARAAINGNHWHLSSSKFPDQLCDVQSVRKKPSPRQRTKRFLQWRAGIGRCTRMSAVPKLKTGDGWSPGSDLRRLQGFSWIFHKCQGNESRLRLFIPFF